MAALKARPTFKPDSQTQKLKAADTPDPDRDPVQAPKVLGRCYSYKADGSVKVTTFT